MADILIKKLDETEVFVECVDQISRELSRFFAIRAPNYQWSPLYKQGRWDGYIRFFSGNHRLPMGLVQKIFEFAKAGKYTIELTFKSELELDKEKFCRFVDNLSITDSSGNLMDPRDYQLDAAYEACTKRHIAMEVPTAGGKTLIAYIISRFMEKANKKILIIVPTVNLVEQTFGDFRDYGWKNVEDYCHRIYSGQKKLFSSPVVISTWQSLTPLAKKDPKMFLEFDAILADEAHGAKALCLKQICSLAKNARWRMGQSGTYPDSSSADWYNIVGSLGPIKKFVSYKQLQERGHIAGLNIFSIILKYPHEIKQTCQSQCEGDYQKEGDFIHTLEKRNEFISKLVNRLEKNTLVLFTKIEKHGVPLKAKLEQTLKDKKVIFIYGGTAVEDREMARKIAEQNDNIVILASYGTFSQGVNIKNIHNIVFASGYKSRIKVLQSIGRGLRKMKDKISLNLYDLVDDLSFSSKIDRIRFINFSVRHYKERIKVYDKEGFDHKSIVYEII